MGYSPSAVSPPHVAEIVIAGAGMAGVAAAHQLAVREGVTGVVLVDPREPLSLTSSKGTEAYRNYWPGPDDTMVRFMNRSIDLLDALDRESGHASSSIAGATCFSRPIPPKPSDCEGTRARQRSSSTTDGVHERYPFVTGRVRAMLHVRRAGYMNAHARTVPARARTAPASSSCATKSSALVVNERSSLPFNSHLDRASTHGRSSWLRSSAPEWTDRICLRRADRQRAPRQDFIRGPCQRDST